MKRAVLACLVATILVSCTSTVDPAKSSSSGSSPSLRAAPDAATLLARPLKLPAVHPGSTCPVTLVASRDVGIGSPRGKGPFYVGGPMPKGYFPWNKTVWVLVDGASWPVLFRGGRVDGAGTLMFSGIPADPSDKGVNLSSGGGVSAKFYERVIDRGTSDAFYVYPPTSGCYALQVDGPTFEDVIIFSAA